MGRIRGLGAATVAGALGVGCGLVVTGRLTLDTGVGRTTHPLGPITVSIAAPRETVFDVIAAPYLGRPPRALAHQITVWERGTDVVLAAHRTPVGAGVVTTTVETVRFTPPTRVDFRLVRGPVPHAVERFELFDDAGTTTLTYAGELGVDVWTVGRWWARVVVPKWEATVRASVERIRAEAERRATATARPQDS